MGLLFVKRTPGRLLTPFTTWGRIRKAPFVKQSKCSPGSTSAAPSFLAFQLPELWEINFIFLQITHSTPVYMFYYSNRKQTKTSCITLNPNHFGLLMWRKFCLLHFTMCIYIFIVLLRIIYNEFLAFWRVRPFSFFSFLSFCFTL